ASRAEVNGKRRLAALEVRERRHVTLCEIDDVNVVAHPGAVGRRVIASPDAQGGQAADRDLRDVREEVVRNSVRVLAQTPRGVRPRRVEVAQRRIAET